MVMGQSSSFRVVSRGVETMVAVAVVVTRADIVTWFIVLGAPIYP